MPTAGPLAGGWTRAVGSRPSHDARHQKSRGAPIRPSGLVVSGACGADSLRRAQISRVRGTERCRHPLHGGSGAVEEDACHLYQTTPVLVGADIVAAGPRRRPRGYAAPDPAVNETDDVRHATDDVVGGGGRRPRVRPRVRKGVVWPAGGSWTWRGDCRRIDHGTVRPDTRPGTRDPRRVGSRTPAFEAFRSTVLDERARCHPGQVATLAGPPDRAARSRRTSPGPGADSRCRRAPFELPHSSAGWLQPVSR
jgi:hypothetical protein